MSNLIKVKLEKAVPYTIILYPSCPGFEFNHSNHTYIEFLAHEGQE